MKRSKPRASRREVLLALATAPLAACTGTSAPPAAFPGMTSPSLDTLARRTGRRFGSVIASYPGGRNGATIQNPDYAALVQAECGVVVPENAMKWSVIRPAADRFDFRRMDQIAAWTVANGLGLRGHTLLWHRPERFPRWLNDHDFGANPAREAERLLAAHVGTVAQRYAGVVGSFDVVNEAIDQTEHQPMQTSLSRAMGSAEAVLDLAFHTAREHAPTAQLVYNDFMSWEPQHIRHCADVLRLLEGFRRRGVPVDALGIQSHIEMFSLDPATGLGPYSERDWRAFLDEVVAMGYKLVITEFDVKDKALPSAVPVRDAKVAEYARRYLGLMLEYPQLTDVLVWGMVDKFSWLQDFVPRDDDQEVRGCPYDARFQAKPLRTAIAESFAAA